MKKKRRLLILLLLIGISSVIALLATETGLRTVLYAAKVIIPTQFSYGEVKGRLISHFSIDSIYYRDATIQISIEDFSAKWKFLELFNSKFEITPKLRNIEIHLFPSPANPQPPTHTEISNIDIPIDIAVRELELTNLRILSGDSAYHIASTRIDLNIADNSLILNEARVINTFGKVRLKGNFSLQKPFDLNLENQIVLELADTQFEMTGNLAGNMHNLTVSQKLERDTRGRLQISLKDILEQVSWKAELTVQHSNYLEKILDTREPISGTINSSGDLDYFILGGGFSSVIGGLNYQLDFLSETENMQSWTLKTIALKSRHMNLFASGYYSAETGYGINAYWDKFNWKLPEFLELSSNRGAFSLSGKSNQYSYSIDGNLKIPDYLPESDWKIEGSGSDSELFVKQSSIKILGGSLHVLLAADWSENFRWTGSIITKDIDLTHYYPNFKSKINSEFALYGVHTDDKIQLAGINLVSLSGNLNRAALGGHGNISYNENKLVVDEFEIHAGKNLASINGAIDAHTRFDMNLDLRQLEVFDIKTSGTIKSTISVREIKNQGEMDAIIALKNLSSGNLSVKKSDGTIAIRTHRPWNELQSLDIETLLLAFRSTQIKLTGDNIKVSNKNINTIKVNLDGETKSAKLDVAMDAKFGSGRFSYSMRHNGSSWTGEIERALYNDPQLGVWKNNKISAVIIDNNSVKLNRLCLVQVDQELCADAAWNDSGTNVHAILRNFSVSSLADFLPKNLFMSTVIQSAEMNFRSENQIWRGSIDITTSNGQITYLLPNGEFLSFSHHIAKLQGRLDDQKLTSFLSLPISEGLGELKTSLDLKEQPNLDLNTNIVLKNINNFVSVIPELQDTKGKINIKIGVNDLLNTPKLVGSVNFTGGNTKIPRLGLELKEVVLSLDTQNPETLHLTGSGKSDNGTLNIDSQIDTHLDENWQLSGIVSGKDFLAANMPEYRVVASPNLKVDLTQNHASLSGTINIPHARLNPRDLSSATQTSSDEIIISETEKKVAAKPYLLKSNIRLSMGKDVRFEGFGLKCRLEGDLKIIDQENSPTLASGEIRVVEGKYQAYNQNFDIETGKLLYAGGPVSNPALHLTAYRQIKEIRVGIQVRGTLLKPSLKLVSEPVMDESDILSYLIFERPIGQINSEEQGKDLQKLALEVIGNEFLASKIGKKLGLEDIRLESSETTDVDSNVNRDISLVVGKFLSPKLYVSYGVGLIEHAQSLNIRYNITKKLSFEASKGTEAGGDLIYTIERDK